MWRPTGSRTFSMMKGSDDLEAGNDGAVDPSCELGLAVDGPAFARVVSGRVDRWRAVRTSDPTRPRHHKV